MNAQLPTLTPRLPRDGAAWASFMGSMDIPVLSRTAAVIEELRELEDAVDAHLLADGIGNDPLMSLKVLAHVARQPWKHRTTDAETVTEALVMLGIGPFFRAFGGRRRWTNTSPPSPRHWPACARCCAARTAGRPSRSASRCTAWTTTHR
jgi:hypothetical protein